MAQVTVTVNGRPYQVGCADGQEDRVLSLAKELDARARLLAEASGSVNEGLVLVLAGLMVADEAADERAARATAEDELAQLNSGEGTVALREHIGALQDHVTMLEDQLARTQGELAEAHDALRAAHERLEQRREDVASRQELEGRVADAIEALAARIETVAETLRAP